MDIREILSCIIDLAHGVHEKYKQYQQLDISVAQQADNLGLSLQVKIHAGMPPGALLFGRIDGYWLGSLLAVDELLYRDENNNFLSIGPIQGQVGTIYIPYGAAQVRSPGLHTLTLGVHLLDPKTSNTTEIAQASYKLIVPPQHPWRRVEFFWPLIRLCMAIIRVDNEVLPAEVRGLRELLVNGLSFRPEDMPDLRLVMKDTTHGDLGALLDSVKLRMPMLTPEGLLEILCKVALLDGPINPHEHALLRHISDLLGIPRARYAALTAAPAPVKALSR